MVNKPKAIEIVKNLKQTLGKMSTIEAVQREASIYENRNNIHENHRPSKISLKKIMNKLINFYKLNNEDLK